MIPEIGDSITFVPKAYSSGVSNGMESAKEQIRRNTVTGKVIGIHRKHGWYRVAWKPNYDRVQHECFKFYP